MVAKIFTANGQGLHRPINKPLTPDDSADKEGHGLEQQSQWQTGDVSPYVMKYDPEMAMVMS